jgi:hypothetical protein
MLDAGAENRPVGCGIAERMQIRLAQRPLPHEQLVADTPEALLAAQRVTGLRQGKGEAPDIVPGRDRVTVAQPARGRGGPSKSTALFCIVLGQEPDPK